MNNTQIEGRIIRADQYHRGLPDVFPGYERVDPIHTRRLLTELFGLDLTGMREENKDAEEMMEELGIKKPRSVSRSTRQIIPEQIKVKDVRTTGDYTVLRNHTHEDRNNVLLIVGLLKKLNLDYDLVVYEHERELLNGYVAVRMADKIIFICPTLGSAYIIHSQSMTQFMHRTANELKMLVPHGLVSICEQDKRSSEVWLQEIEEELKQPNPKEYRDAQESIDNTHPTPLPQKAFTISRLAREFPGVRWDKLDKFIKRAMTRLANEQGIDDPRKLISLHYDSMGRVVFVYPAEIRERLEYLIQEEISV